MKRFFKFIGPIIILIMIAGIVLGYRISVDLRNVQNLLFSSSIQEKILDIKLGFTRKEYIYFMILSLTLGILLIIAIFYIKGLSQDLAEINNLYESLDLKYSKELQRIINYSNEIENRVKELEKSLQEWGKMFSFLCIEKRPKKIGIEDVLNAKAFKEFFKKLEEFIEQLRSSSKEVIELFNGLESIIRESSANSNFIQEKVQDIEKVAQMIRKIINQTRLIAFNAAIESSKSAREGKGFNVIVSQIRNLVDEIEETTGEIQETAKELAGSSSKIVLLSEIATKRQHDGKILSEEIFKTLDSFSVLSLSSKKLIEEIETYNTKFKNLVKEFSKESDFIKTERKKIKELEETQRRLLEDILILTNNLKKGSYIYEKHGDR